MASRNDSLTCELGGYCTTDGHRDERRRYAMKPFPVLTICAILASPLVVTGAYGYFVSRPQVATVADASQPAELLLRARLGTSFSVTSIVVIGSGELTGTGEIALLDRGARVQKRALLDSAQFRIAADWYEPEAGLRYTPILGASGTIRLRYAFSGPGSVAALAFVFLLSSAVALVAGRFVLLFGAGGTSRRQREAHVAALRRRLEERRDRRDGAGPPPRG